ncbi:MAG: hypothetical protein H6Q36_416, partial [Chloroflexi bacterium]|nr:hypothetical protein [Chloroflexota bacterium]
VTQRPPSLTWTSTGGASGTVWLNRTFAQLPAMPGESR